MKKEKQGREIIENDRLTTDKELAEMREAIVTIWNEKPEALKIAEGQEAVWRRLLKFRHHPEFRGIARAEGVDVDFTDNEDGSIKEVNIRDRETGEILFYSTDKNLPEGSLPPGAYRSH